MLHNMSKDNTYFLLPGSPCLVDTDFITNTFLYFLRRYSMLSTTTIDKLNSHCSTPREYLMFKHSSRVRVRGSLASTYPPSEQILFPRARKHWAAPSRFPILINCSRASLKIIDALATLTRTDFSQGLKALGSTKDIAKSDELHSSLLQHRGSFVILVLHV